MTIALKSAPSVTIDRPMPKGRVHVEVAGEIVSAARVVAENGKPTIEGWTERSTTILLRSDSDGPAYEVERNGKEIAVRDLPQKELTVTIEDADRRPVSNLECELIDDHPKFPRARRVASDASGKFSVRGLVGETARLEFGPQNDLFDSRRRVEVVALEGKSTEHVLRIGEKRRFDIDIRLAGRRTIPSVFTILAVKAFTGKIAEDRDLARITVDFWNDDRIAAPEFIVHAPGYQPQAVMLPLEGDVVTREIDLEPAGRVVLQIVGAEVKETDLFLDWISDADVATTLQHGGRSRSPRSCEVEFDGLKNGRYRIRDGTTGLASAPFSIENADRTTRVTMNMAALQSVELRPEFGDGERERPVVFQISPESDSPFETITRAIMPPSSSVKIPRETNLRIRALDPEFVIATRDGTVTLEPDVDHIALPLVRGASVRLLLPEDSCGMGSAIMERLDTEQRSIVTRLISSQGEIGRFGAVPAGRWKITIRLDDHLPLEVGEWTLAPEENRLPEFDFDPGSSIVFRFAESTIGRLPPLEITVRSNDGKVERVGAYRKDERSVTIGGLTAGLKTIEFRGKNLGLVAPPATRAVRLDAHGEIVVEIE